jgi:signal transduction histidine kinase
LITEGDHGTWAAAVTQAVVRAVGARSADLSVEEQGDDLAGLDSPPGARHVRRFPLAVDGRALGMLTVCWDVPPSSSGLRRLEAVVADVSLAASVRTSMQAQQRRVQALERLRTARRIHDTVVQRLCGVSMVVGALGERDADLKTCGEELTTALDELRGVLRLECDDADPQTPGASLAAVLDSYGRQIRLHRTGEPELAGMAHDAAEIFVAGVREGLQNVVRHAQATVTSVRFADTPEEVGVVIHNDGAAAAATRPGVGLQLLSFSVLERGGMLWSEAQGSGEWRFELWLPRR